MAKIADHMDKIADSVVKGYQKIEDGVVTGYKKVENAFVGTFIAREGESVEEVKNRIAAEQKPR